MWQRFCNYSNKNDSFTLKDIVGFLRRYPIKIGTAKFQMEQLARMYYRKTNKDFFEDFPGIKDYNFQKRCLVRKFEAEEGPLSEYEKIRLKNISTRQEMFGQLDLGKKVSDLSASKQKYTARPKSLEPVKKSRRLQNVDAEKEALSFDTRQLSEIWKKFCSYANKTENFTQDDVMGFLEKLLLPKSYSGIYPESSSSKTLSMYKMAIAAMYSTKFNRNFDIDFPDIDDFVIEKCPVEEKEIWARFYYYNFQITCVSRKKIFTDANFITYFGMLSKTGVKVSTLKAISCSLAGMYFKKMGDDCFKKFPIVKSYISELMNNDFWTENQQNVWEKLCLQPKIFLKKVPIPEETVMDEMPCIA